MTRKLRALLCLLLSLTLLCGLCACGAEEEPAIDPDTYDPNDSYHVTRNQDGTYSFFVADYAGNIFYSRENETYEPKFTKLTETVLQITVPSAGTIGSKWAVFCDVRSKKVSNIYGDFLAAKGNCVAKLESLSEQYHVFVREIFHPEAEPQVTTLEWLQPSKDGGLYEKAVLNKDGDLEITYETRNGTTTTIVDMP